MSADGRAGMDAAGTLAAALEREHSEIDAGIEAFVAGGDGAAGSLREALAALRRHIYLEEEFLFPPLREAGMVAPVFVMVREHGEMWRTMEALEADLGADSAGAAAARCDELLEQLERHNLKEEGILYPQADAALGVTAADGLRRFLAEGRMPEGWVCSGLRRPGAPA